MILGTSNRGSEFEVQSWKAKGQGHWERKCKSFFAHTFVKIRSIYAKLDKSLAHYKHFVEQ